MRLIKMLGLTAIAAVAAMAVIGASSASANTVLCKVLELPCSEENAYPSGTEFTALSPEAVLTGLEPATEVKCHSITRIKTLATEGLPLHGDVTELDFLNCTEGCTVTVLNLPYLALLEWTEGDNGSLTVEKGVSSAGPPKARIKCGFGFLKCLVGEEKVLLKVDGGEPAKVLASNVLFKLLADEGILECPAQAHWNATYTALGSNSTAYVSHL